MRGRRPTATRSSSPRSSSPPSSSQRDLPALAARGADRLDARSAARPRRRSSPARDLLARERLLVGEHPVERLDQGRRSAPRLLHACASSTPTTPPPRISSRPGTSLGGGRLAVGPRARLARGPRSAGSPPSVPVAITTAFAARQRDRRRRSRCARRRAPRGRGSARSRAPSSHGSMPESSRSWITSSRRARTGSRVELAARPARATPGDPLGLGQQLAGPQQRLRRHAGVERALAADQLLLDDRHPQPAVGGAAGADLARRAGPDHDHVELPLAICPPVFRIGYTTSDGDADAARQALRATAPSATSTARRSRATTTSDGNAGGDAAGS